MIEERDDDDFEIDKEFLKNNIRKHPLEKWFFYKSL